MNITITGGYGFIGTNLYEILTRNYKDIVVDRPLKHQPYNKPDIIYHLAAYSRVQGSNNPENNVFENNITSLKETLEFARSTKSKVIFTSTSYCMVEPYANYYAFSKHVGEELCAFYRKIYGVNVVVVRLFNVYGNIIPNYPQWKLGVVDKYLLDKSRGSGYVINNTGEQKRDYVHVYDVVEALITLGSETVDPEKTYEVGTGKLYSVNQIAKIIFGNQLPESRQTAEGEIFESKTFGGIELIKDLGWEPRIKLEEYLKSF